MKIPFLLLLLIALGFLIIPGSAYQYDFQSADDMSGWVYKNGGAPSLTTTTYSDLYTMTLNVDFAPLGGYNHAYQTTSYPTNYWAFTYRGGGGGVYFGLKDISGNFIVHTGTSAITATVGDRFEFIREGDLHVRAYVNGVYTRDLGAATSVPYYMMTYGYEILDDVVIGTTEEHNIISCPPQTWFVAKDIVDSGFSGLYSAPNTQVYAHEMHCSYATDDGSATIVTKHMATNTVVNTTTVSSYAGIITYNLTTMLFESGAPYGIYWVYDYDNPMATDQFEYRAIATSGTSIMWNQSTYNAGETALLNFSIAESYWDTDDYSYAVVIWDEEFNNVYEIAIPARPVEAELTVDIDDFVTDAGTYYAVILATDLSSAEELMFAYDDMYADILGASDVIVTGTTYDATTGNLLGSVEVTATQLGAGNSDTSDAGTGEYEITGLVTDWSIGVNGTKTGYAGYLTAFTPYVGGTYGIDVPMVPTGGPDPGAYFDVTGGQITVLTHNNVTTSYYNLTEDGTAVGGIVYLSPYWALGKGVNCTLWNETWSDTNFTNDAGWYQINNIPLDTETGTYALTYSLDGYSTVNSSVLIYNNSFNRVDAYMEGTYNLTVEIRELTSHALITVTTVELDLDTGESGSTTSGTYTFTNLSYGSYTVTAVADGYYPGSNGAVLDADKTVTVYIQSQTGPDDPGPFNLTVYVKDIETLALLTSTVSLSLDTGESAETTTGTYKFEDLDYGSYTVTAIASGYYPGTAGVALDADKITTVYMTINPGSSIDPQMQYSGGIDTRFVVQNKYGKPLPGTTVVLTPTSTTLANWSWMNDLLGIPETVMLNNTTLSGVTDTMGGIDFVVLRETYYKIDFTNVAEGVSTTEYLYPKDDFYVFTVATDDTAETNSTVTAGISWTLTNTTINSTHESLLFTYTDPSGMTTNLSFWVNSQASPVTCCHQEYSATPSSASCSYTATATSGTGYTWGFDAVNGEVGNFTDSAAISFSKLVDLGIPSYYYGWIAAAFVIVLGGFFSVINVRFGAVLVPCVAYLFWWMKWLTMGPTTATILGVLLIIAVISYIRKQENKE